MSTRKCGYCKHQLIFRGTKSVWTCQNEYCENHRRTEKYYEAQFINKHCSCEIDDQGIVIKACEIHVKWLAKYVRRYND
jgi:hypothetical protein